MKSLKLFLSALLVVQLCFGVLVFSPFSGTEKSVMAAGGTCISDRKCTANDGNSPNLTATANGSCGSGQTTVQISISGSLVAHNGEVDNVGLWLGRNGGCHTIEVGIKNDDDDKNMCKDFQKGGDVSTFSTGIDFPCASLENGMANIEYTISWQKKPEKSGPKDKNTTSEIENALQILEVENGIKDDKKPKPPAPICNPSVDTVASPAPHCTAKQTLPVPVTVVAPPPPTPTYPNLTISKSADSTVVSGSTFTYTISYANTGSGTATGVTIKDTLPDGTIYVSGSTTPSIGDPTISGQLFTWNIPTLTPSTTGKIEITVDTVGVTSGLELKNTAYIKDSLTGEGSGTGSNEVTTLVTYTTIPDSGTTGTNVSITKLVNATLLEYLSPIVYTINYLNSGQTGALNLVIQDILPTGVTSRVYSTGGAEGNIYQLLIPFLPAGAGGTITITGSITITGGTISNTATLSADNDTNSTDNSSTVSREVTYTNPGNGTGTTDPGNGTGTTDPGNGTGTTDPGNGTGTTDPGNGTGTTDPGNGTGTTDPGNGTGTTDPGNGTGTTTPPTTPPTAGGGGFAGGGGVLLPFQLLDTGAPEKNNIVPLIPQIIPPMLLDTGAPVGDLPAMTGFPRTGISR